MNIIEIERLVRRIHGILKGEGEAAMAPKLAEQMKTVCASVALRLEQCRSMIEAGAAAQAIQLAETTPNLMDLVTLVEFREADEWRQYCQQKGLPAPEKLNARAVTMLNDCYSRGITPQHPVYDAYREAVFAKNDQAARMALLSIVRLNPGDANAAAELTRLDAKNLGEQMAKLERCLASGDDGETLRQLERIETLGFKTKLAGDVWKSALMVRCKKLLDEGEAFMLNGALTETIAQMDWLALIKAEHELHWPDDWLDRFTRLQEWCRSESVARQEDADYQNQLGELQNIIGMHEGVPQRASISELQAEVEALRKARRRLEKSSRPAPEALRQRCLQVEARLEEQIARVAKKRFTFAAVSVTAAVLVLAAMAVAGLGMRNANDLTVKLKSATDEHEVSSLKSLVQKTKSPMVFGTASLKAAVAAANAEIDRQSGSLAEFETIFKKLPSKFDSINTLEEIDSVGTTISSAEQAQTLLVPELQKDAGRKIQEFRSRWTSYCQQMQPTINRQVDEYIKNEDVPAHTDNIKDVGQFRDKVEAAIPRLEGLSRIITGLNNYVTVPADMAGHCTALLAQLHQTEASADKLKADVEALRQTKSLPDFAQLVNELGAIPIDQSDYKQAAQRATAVSELKDVPEALSRKLLAGDNATLWGILCQTSAPDLMPSKVTTEVRHRYMGVMQDYAVNGNHHRFDIYLDEQHSQRQSWITSDALRNEEGWHAVPGWNLDNPGKCEFKPLDYGSFGGKYRLSDKVLVFEIKDTSMADMTAIWTGSGFARLLNSRAMTYNLPPLKVADALCADQSSSPLLRAYLLQELVAIMEQQPEASGLIFVPELRNLSARLQEAGADGIQSGDWFIAARVTALQPGLDKMFNSLKAVSYEQEASKFMDGIKTAVKSGFIFSGYVTPDGSPYWNSSPADGYVWGYQLGTAEAVLLYVVHDGQVRPVNKALPLTPLLLFSGDLPGIVAKAGVHTGAQSSQQWLPPLFAAMPATP